jgi:hypothetical protein
LSYLIDLLWKIWTVKRKDASECLHHSPYPNLNPKAQKPWRTVVETELFAAQRTKLGNAQKIDEALRGVYATLSSSPEQYSIEPGTRRFRTAPTDLVEWAGGPVQALLIWYTIESDETVLLHALDQLEDLRGVCLDTADSIMNVSAVIPS